MSSRLDGPLAKVARANEHIQQFVVVAGEFFKSDPYRIVVQEDSKTGNVDWVLQVRADPPLALSLIAGDVIHNLRSALDLLAWQLVLDGGGTPIVSGPNATSYPIMDGRKAFKSIGLRRVQGATKDAKDLISATRPYKRGNDALWQIHRLDIVDKHRLLVAVGASHRNIILTFPTPSMIRDMKEIFSDIPVFGEPGELALIPEDRQFPLEDGDVLFSDATPNVPKEDRDPKFTFEIAISEPGVVEGESLGPLLIEFADQVQGLIEAFRPIMRS
jgi:hypothetical protein